MTRGSAVWTPAYIGLGSNLENPATQVAAAIDRIAKLPESSLQSVSSLYSSRPMGPENQPDFVNAVACLLTKMPARRLLDELLAIELAAGRRRDGERWGPRVLDLDLLMYGRQQIDEATLTVPHPGIAERNFVLFPLREIAPHAHVPGLGSVSALADRLPVDDFDIARLDP